MDWETAFLSQYQDACTGRLLRGILHNLNGVHQAFALQAALLKNMFSQAEQLLAESAAQCPGVECQLLRLRDLLGKRAVMVEQMEAKLDTSQRIVARTMPLAHLYGLEHEGPVSVSSIVELEMEILAADAFFKHKIDRKTELAADLPLLRRHCAEIHTILFALLENSIAALRDTPAPKLRLAIRRDENALIMEVRDSGPGIAPQVAATLFDPFVSTRPESLGVGLFVAQKAAQTLGGRIDHSSHPGDTCFTVTLPLAELT